jgi:hypothetical protein
VVCCEGIERHRKNEEGRVAWTVPYLLLLVEPPDQYRDVEVEEHEVANDDNSQTIQLSQTSSSVYDPGNPLPTQAMETVTDAFEHDRFQSDEDEDCSQTQTQPIATLMSQTEETVVPETVVETVVPLPYGDSADDFLPESETVPETIMPESVLETIVPETVVDTQPADAPRVSTQELLFGDRDPREGVLPSVRRGSGSRVYAPPSDQDVKTREEQRKRRAKDISQQPAPAVPEPTLPIPAYVQEAIDMGHITLSQSADAPHKKRKISTVKKPIYQREKSY